MKAEKPKQALIITYYWPPCGGSGVQRWLKFAKYLREFGWEPIVYTVKNGEYPALDESLLKDVPEGMEIIQSEIWEPYQWYKKFVGRRKDDRMKPGFIIEKGKMSLREKFSRWVRGNFFIPDARKFWIKPSVKFLVERLRANPVDVIISTSTPQSSHMIALGVKRKTGIPWLADFRDPWTTIYFFKDLGLSKAAEAKHKQMEADVIREADAVTVVGAHLRGDLMGIVNRKIEVIPNGYDDSDIAGSGESMAADFCLTYIGMFMDTQNHEALWNGILDARNSDPQFAADFRLHLVGNVDHSILASISRCGLDTCMERKNYVAHSEVGKLLSQSAVLLLSINKGANAKGILTGKLFEYLAARRPILCVGPVDGDAAAVISETGAGVTIPWEDAEGISRLLRKWYSDWKSGKLVVESSGIEKYSRRELTGNLAKILDGIRKKK